MNSPDDKLHVVPQDDHWEVDAPSGLPLASAESRAEAVDVAQSLAAGEGVDTVVVHDLDGPQTLEADPQA